MIVGADGIEPPAAGERRVITSADPRTGGAARQASAGQASARPGLGGQLLFDAYQRVLAATRTVAARYLVVAAIDDTAVGFYEHYGFTRSPGEPSMRLIRKLGDIQADVDFQS